MAAFSPERELPLVGARLLLASFFFYFMIGLRFREAARANLRSPEARQRMRTYQSILSSVGDWNRVVLLDLPVMSEYSRRSLADVARERGQDAYDAAFDIIEATLDLPRSPMVMAGRLPSKKPVSEMTARSAAGSSISRPPATFR